MRKITSLFVLVAFLLSCVTPPQGFAQSLTAVGLMPEPGTPVALSSAFMPAHLKGMVINPTDPFKFDFIIYRGDEPLTGTQKQDEYTKLIKYFLASLAVPDSDQWVNLSPYEKDRIIPDGFGLTEMGRDLLAQDYLLKQISASLTNPDTDLGKKFWDGLYEQAYQKFGTTDIPTDTFNKVWIVPDKAVVYEKGNTVYVLEHHLKVMMESDYKAMKENSADSNSEEDNEAVKISKQVMREVIIPAIEKEVNEARNFAPLRQVYSGMLLASWYKLALKESILGKLYADKSKVKGVDQDPKTNQKIFEQYVAAFKKGVFNMIKEDVDRYTEEIIPRKYFSGGAKNTYLKGDGSPDVLEVKQGDVSPDKVAENQFLEKTIDYELAGTLFRNSSEVSNVAQDSREIVIDNKHKATLTEGRLIMRENNFYGNRLELFIAMQKGLSQTGASIAEGSLNGIVWSTTPGQTYQDFDSSMKNAPERASASGQNRLKKVDLSEEFVASGLAKYLSSIEGWPADLQGQIEALKERSAAIMTVNELLGMLPNSELIAKNGFSLGISGPVYEALSKVGNLTTWKVFYKRNKWELRERVDEHLSALKDMKTPIIFLIPRNIFEHENARVVKDEIIAIFKDPEILKNVRFVFGGDAAVPSDYYSPKEKNQESEEDVKRLEDIYLKGLPSAALIEAMTRDVESAAEESHLRWYGLKNETKRDVNDPFVGWGPTRKKVSDVVVEGKLMSREDVSKEVGVEVSEEKYQAIQNAVAKSELDKGELDKDITHNLFSTDYKALLVSEPDGGVGLASRNALPNLVLAMYLTDKRAEAINTREGLLNVLQGFLDGTDTEGIEAVSKLKHVAFQLLVSAQAEQGREVTVRERIAEAVRNAAKADFAPYEESYQRFQQMDKESLLPAVEWIMKRVNHLLADSAMNARDKFFFEQDLPLGLVKLGITSTQESLERKVRDGLAANINLLAVTLRNGFYQRDLARDINDLIELNTMGVINQYPNEYGSAARLLSSLSASERESLIELLQAYSEEEDFNDDIKKAAELNKRARFGDELKFDFEVKFGQEAFDRIGQGESYRKLFETAIARMAMKEYSDHLESVLENVLDLFRKNVTSDLTAFSSVPASQNQKDLLKALDKPEYSKERDIVVAYLSEKREEGAGIPTMVESAVLSILHQERIQAQRNSLANVVLSALARATSESFEGGPEAWEAASKEEVREKLGLSVLEVALKNRELLKKLTAYRQVFVDQNNGKMPWDYMTRTPWSVAAFSNTLDDLNDGSYYSVVAPMDGEGLTAHKLAKEIQGIILNSIDEHINPTPKMSSFGPILDVADSTSGPDAAITPIIKTVVVDTPGDFDVLVDTLKTRKMSVELGNRLPTAAYDILGDDPIAEKAFNDGNLILKAIVRNYPKEVAFLTGYEQEQSKGIYRVQIVASDNEAAAAGQEAAIALMRAKKAEVADDLKGGIDLNAANLNLQIKRDGNGVPLPISEQDLENIKIDGLVPVILNIRPALGVPLFSEAASATPLSA